MKKTIKPPLKLPQMRDKRDSARNKISKVAGQILFLIILVGVLVLPYFVFAKSAALEKLEKVGVKEGGYAVANETTFSSILGTVVSAFLSLLGVIFIILIIYAGHKWMTASGNEEKVSAAKETLWRAIIGLVIVIGAYAIWAFVYWQFISA